MKEEWIQHYPELVRMHGEMISPAADLLKAALLDMPKGSPKGVMYELAALITAERAWLRLYAQGGKVVAEWDEGAAGYSPSKVERFDELWAACEAEAEGVLGAFLPGKAG